MVEIEEEERERGEKNVIVAFSIYLFIAGKVDRLPLASSLLCLTSRIISVEHYYYYYDNNSKIIDPTQIITAVVVIPSLLYQHRPFSPGVVLCPTISEHT